MSKWDALRDKFKNRQEQAFIAQERASQKLAIIKARQGDLWSSLQNEFVSAINEINTGGSFVHYTDSIPGGGGFRLNSIGDASQKTITARFDSNNHWATFELTGSNILRYHIDANDDNKAEFRNANEETVTLDDIVREVLGKL